MLFWSVEFSLFSILLLFSSLNDVFNGVFIDRETKKTTINDDSSTTHL